MSRLNAFALCLVLFVSSAGSLLAQENKTKKFLTKPLVIEDQGSFFIEGLPKITGHATVPPANNPNQANTPNQITIGQMSVQFQIPAHKPPKGPPVSLGPGSSPSGASLE